MTCLSGITATDADGMLRVISEGGGTRFFKPFVIKWNVPLEPMTGNKGLIKVLRSSTETSSTSELRIVSLRREAGIEKSLLLCQQRL